MTRQLSKLWLLVLLATVAFASCDKNDRTEPNSLEQGSGETVTLSLSAEVGFEEEAPKEGDLKGLNFKIENVNGKRIPRPQLEDEQEVDVVTVIKSSVGPAYAQKIKWKYVATTRSLVLLRGYTDNDITIPNFNNDSNVKWYIAGFLPTGEYTLSGINNSKVELKQTQSLKGISGNVGEALGSLNIPYWTGWMELLIESSSPNTRDGNNSYSNAKVQTSGAKFRPLGSLIAYKFGNRLTSGNHTFIPTGFTVGSNSFGDKGTFDLNSPIPNGNPESALPRWVETPEPMTYTFATGHAPGTISKNANSSKIYYAWVMPHNTQPIPTITRVKFKGTSSKYAFNPERDYTKTYYTDYIPKITGSMGKPKQGRIYELKANVTHRVALPIEYVTEYNLAGGGLYSNLSINGVKGQTPDGLRGPLRFSNHTEYGSDNTALAHRNDQSGYYNSYHVSGSHNLSFNPYTIRLKKMIDDTFDPNKYFIPSGDHFQAIWPIPKGRTRKWAFQSSLPNNVEYFEVDFEQQETMYALSDYSENAPVNDGTEDAVFYGIRLRATTSTSPINQYQPLLDNSLKCAYRCTRIGGKSLWRTSNNNQLHTQIKIDVVYLGEEATPTQLSTISNPSWWLSKRGQGKVITRIFPAAGIINEMDIDDPRGSIMYRGRVASYQLNDGWQPHVNEENFSFGASGGGTRPIRLFKRDPDVE